MDTRAKFQACQSHVNFFFSLQRDDSNVAHSSFVTHQEPLNTRTYDWQLSNTMYYASDSLHAAATTRGKVVCKQLQS